VVLEKEVKMKKRIDIAEHLLDLKFSRSSGPGGQNVNKVNTRVTVFFNVGECDLFCEAEKNRILRKLSTRADKNGVIRVVSQKHRTQKANRRAAIEKLTELIDEALRPVKVRRRTRVPTSAKIKRLEEKKKRGILKQQRAKKDWQLGQ
jgi:ribosome-associated protein